MSNTSILNGGYYLWMGLLAFALISSCIVLSINIVIDENASRKKGFRKISKSGITKEKIDELLASNLDYKKRKNTEKLILQAGYKFSILDFYIMSLGCAILLSMLVLIVLNNPFAAILLFIIGFMTPRQVLNSKRSKRLDKLNNQVGSFISIVIGRYEMLNDFSQSLRMSIEECRGQEPIASEIQQTILDLDLGISVIEAMEEMSIRTGNKYIEKLTNNYKIASNIGTKEARKTLLGYVIDEYNTETVAKAELKKELKGPIMEAYLMCAMVPGVMIMQTFMTEGYIEFMTQELLGKIGTGVIITSVVAGIWFINAKVNAPLD